MDGIRSSLGKRFPNNQTALQFYGPILELFAASGSADKNFCKEVRSADDGQFWSRVWEAILFKRFHDLGWKIAGTGLGPDFRLEGAKFKTLVEATVPSPDGLPAAWLSDNGGAFSVPNEAMLLRWTSSLSTKSRKHLADIEKGVVSASEPFVIAINSCRLSRFSEELGVSQWPFAVEAVFPVGPLAVPINRETGKLGNVYQSLRFSISKRKNLNIPTDSFLNPGYAHVSAILGCASCYADQANSVQFRGLPVMTLVHNPLAKNPLPRGWLPGAFEYFAEESAPGEFLIKRPDQVS